MISKKNLIRTVQRKSTSLITNFALPSRNSDVLGHTSPENPAFLKMTPDSPLMTGCPPKKGRLGGLVIPPSRKCVPLGLVTPGVSKDLKLQHIPPTKGGCDPEVGTNPSCIAATLMRSS